eukprot:7109584-Pyramimonas_sp.AAC.1
MLRATWWTLRAILWMLRAIHHNRLFVAAGESPGDPSCSSVWVNSGEVPTDHRCHARAGKISSSDCNRRRIVRRGCGCFFRVAAAPFYFFRCGCGLMVDGRYVQEKGAPGDRPGCAGWCKRVPAANHVEFDECGNCGGMVMTTQGVRKVDAVVSSDRTSAGQQQVFAESEGKTSNP